MVATYFLRHFLIVLLLAIGSYAPKSRRRESRPQIRFKDGLTSSQANALRPHLDSLQKQHGVTNSLIKSWMDTSESTEHNERLLSHFFKQGTPHQHNVLPLGQSSTGEGQLAASVLDTDPALNDFLAASSSTSLPRGWQTRSGLTLMEFRSNEKPKVAGLIKFKNRTTAKKLRDSGKFVPLEEFEQTYGLQNVIKVLENHP